MRWGLPRSGRWVAVAVILGLALRTYHYLRCPPVWHDEAALIVNVLRLDFAEMLGPLLHAEAAPPLFLWLVRAVVLVLGDSEYALRLAPFLASCLSLVLFAGLSLRVLGSYAATLAVGLFAVSDRLLWHACEAKPYSFDVLIAAAAAWWFVRTEAWPLWRRCLPVVAVAPLALWISYPTCFVAGGLLLGLFPSVVRPGTSRADRSAYVLLAGVVGLAFATLALGPAAAQRNTAMEACWVNHFPDWSRPWFIPVWAVAGTFEVARYCLIPVGQAAAAFAVFGAAYLWRQGQRELVVVLVLPILLALVAALLHRYPYGGSRLEVFAAPAVCLLSAAGVRRVVPVLVHRSRAAAVVVLALAFAPFGQAAYRTVVPWPQSGCHEAAAFVLRYRQTGEPIVLNHWEYEYYLRSIPGMWRMWAGIFTDEELSAGRVWVIHSDQRRVPEYPFPLPDGWEVVEGREFRTTGVFLLRRADGSKVGDILLP
jgi:hypothetical protein